MGWLEGWLAGWKSRRVDVRSPLSVQDAELRLAAGTAGTSQQLLKHVGLGWGSPIVVGEVSRDRVWLIAKRTPVTNAWRPELRGQLVPDANGCRLIGTFTLPSGVRWFSGCWLGLLTVLIAVALVGAFASLAVGHWTSALHAGGLVLAGAGIGLLFFVFVALSTRSGAKDEAYLRAWLNASLVRGES